MSANSFDESSNLVIEVTSPSDKNDGHFDCTPDDASTDLREKSSKSGFFKKKRAKSPFRSPLKSPIKSPLKSPFKSAKSSKSSKTLKSPTEELLAEDIKDIEEKIKEKNSEEWKAFQQMQERIKLNVLKTQYSLSKISKDDSEESDKPSEAAKPKRRAPDVPKWSTSSYDDQSSLIKERNDSNGIEEDFSVADSQAAMDVFEDLNLSVKTPKPPANSLRTSMENIDEIGIGKSEGGENIEADLLGLSLDNENSNILDTSQTCADEYINQDLLGLENFISSTDSQHGSSLHSSFDGSDMIFGSSVHSSARTTPLGFEDSNLFLSESNQSGVLTSNFVSEMVDEFLQLDTMKEASVSLSLSPFDKDSRKTVATTGLDSLDPFAHSKPSMENIPINPQPVLETKLQEPSFDPFHTVNTESTESATKCNLFDPFEEPGDQNDEQDIDMSVTTCGAPVFDPFDGRKDNTLGRGGVAHVYDNFGFGLADAKRVEADDKVDDQDTEMTTMFDNNENVLVQERTLNPFLDFGATDMPQSNEFNANEPFFDEGFLETANSGKSNVTETVDVWGTENLTSDATDSSVFNPFQSDIFSVDTKQADVSQDTTNLNPFLIDSTQVATVPLNKNPFLDVGESAFDTSDSQPTDVDMFLIDKPVSKEPLAELKSPTLEDLDPFKPTSLETTNTAKFAISGTVNTKQDKLHQFDDDMDDDDDDDESAFKLKIKPVMVDSDTVTKIADIPVAPALKPPPVAPRSPQPPRENPFNRESPPEEDFARFDVMHEKEEEEEEEIESVTEKSQQSVPVVKSSIEKSSSISTTETTTPEEELNLEPLEPFYPLSEKSVWKLMLRQPTKKKLTTNRHWKNVFARVVVQSDGPMLKLYTDEESDHCFQELPLQPCYSISDICLQHYDQYGKIHTVKIQYIFYRERVGLKAERLTPSFVKKPKATMILDHAPQVSELMKFGCLDKSEMQSFVRAIEDALMNLEVHREKTLTYVKEEVCAEVWDEYKAELDKTGKMLTQKARCRVFFLAFVTGMPTCELGLNDKRRRGKEVVGRHDIIPIKTEEWIRIEEPMFHCSVDKSEFQKSNNIRFHPLDGCQVELARYRVRLRENKELPLQLSIHQIMKDSRCEIRCDLLVTGYHSFSKKHGQFPCEDVEIHFPIPEPWIYLFRYERRFGYGSFKSASRKPGKIKGLERITMIAQGLLTPALMEADVGVAKYENLYKAVVWRIPRLPERNEGNDIHSCVACEAGSMLDLTFHASCLYTDVSSSVHLLVVGSSR